MSEPVQKILVLNQFAWPDAAATAQLLDDVVRSLGTRPDVTITIVSGAKPYREGVHNAPPPANLVRIPGPPVGRSRYGRLLSWITYYLGVIVYCLVGPRHDVVISMTTPPLLSVAGWLAQRIRGSRHVIWEMDVYPDIVEAAGMARQGGWMMQRFRDRANDLRKSADSVLVLGSCMKRRLAQQGVPERKLVVCENWATFHGSPFCPPSLPVRPIRLLYSGNLGVAHDVDTLKGALLRLSSLPEVEDRFQLVVAADGGRRKELEQWCTDKQTNFVHFVPLVSREELADRLASCHLGLVTQTRESLGCVVPSKFYGLLAAGRPVLYVGPSDSEVGQVISRTECGFVVEPGDSDALVELLLELERQPGLLLASGKRAFALGASSYSTAAGVARIQAALEPVLTKSAATDAEAVLKISYSR